MSAPNLPSLPSVKQISKYVTRILGQNPGKFTLQGTNTYLIHHPTSPSLILLDTAQNVPSYLPHLREALLSHPIQPCYVSDIILSHWHMDHVDGLRSVLEELGEIGAAGKEGRGTKVWKYRCEGEDEVGKDEGIEGMLEGLKEGLVEIEGSGERLVEGGKIRALKEGQRFTIDGEEDKVDFEVISTPGHTTDSISLLLRSTSSSSSSPLGLFSFDTVLGHGTAVFSSLSTYLNSLSNLISRLPEEEKVPIYPGHGEVIEDGAGKLKEYRKHRLEREEQVVEALKGMKEREGGVTASELTESIYGSTIPASLIPAATRGLLLHLEKLVFDNRVSRQPPPKGTGEKVDWSSMGISEKDVPKGWGDVWSLRGEAN